MKHRVKEIIKFFFPEYQIIETIKEEGFIAKKRNAQVQDMDSAQISSSELLNSRQMNFRANREAIKQGMQNRDSVKNNYPNTYSAQETSRKEQALEKFCGIENIFAEQWIGGKESVNQICQAFMRPFVMGYNNIKPKNTMLLIAEESRGKVFAIETIAQILTQKKILRYADVCKLDMKNYSTSSTENVFLSDLYKALYNQTDVVIFENIEAAFYQYRDIVKALMSEGKVILDKRYYMQNNMLMDTTGTLNANTVSEISANGKYFVFTSVMKQDKTLEMLGEPFVSSINDVIVINGFSKDELEVVVKRVCTEFIKKCAENLKLNVIPDASVLHEIANRYSANFGVKGIQKVFEEELYKPLTEYKMANLSLQGDVSLKYSSGFWAVCANTEVLLDDYIKKYNAIALEKVKEELNEIIGLNTVKEYVMGLENHLKVQHMREQNGLKIASLSMHMIFAGNPGTGKTTIARIVAKYLKAIGVLSNGQLIEVSRADLVGQYMGQTATLTTAAINSALGGVLFIDEAYSLCRDKNDVYGLEAIDALVKGMEDNRDNLLVILAGYDDEMTQFLKTNPGLKSRFPNIVHFNDYTPGEMAEIAKVIAQGKGYKIDEKAMGLLLAEFEKKQIKGRNDSGNGRLVRNLIESAILNQSQRVAKDNRADLELLNEDDFGLCETKKFDLEEALSGIVGLENVKEFVRTQYHLILAREKRKNADLAVDTTQSLNMIFAGNPGTGKTTIARVVAEMLHEMGVLKSGQLVETDKGGLIAEYVGHTAKKTEEVFKLALGGVLFIDEAYSITHDGSGFGQECIDTLVKLIEDYRGEIVVILAGYTKEMKEFMKANSGLESRFPFKIEFPDYSSEELYQIGNIMVKTKGFVFADTSEKVFKNGIAELKRMATSNSGNGRMVRNYVEQIIRNQSTRIALEDVTIEEMNLILPQDIEKEYASTNQYDLEKDLEKVIGLENVKQYIRSLNARLRIQEERKKAGLKVDSTQTMHMIFVGNPGTGKTMMARTVANVLANMGIIKTNKLVETDRAGLVAGYVGQTALKTREVIEGAMDGVLFIDEAYSLAQGGEHDFGREAIDTLVKMMDDNRDRLVVILAGYCEDMEHFVEQNAGLKSRFPNIIEFPDYTTEELLKIATKMYSEQGYILSKEAEQYLYMNFDEAKKDTQFGNGRYVRNVYEKSLNNQALRLSTDNDLSKNDLMIISVHDVKGV